MFRQIKYLLFPSLVLIAMQAGPAWADPTSQGVTTITIEGPKAPSVTARIDELAACTRIKTATDLDNIRNDLGGNYCLANDIDASSIANFTPIGTSSNGFYGTLDGRGFVISHLTINSALGSVGLFGSSEGTIKNIGLVDTNVTGTNYSASVGALVGGLFPATGPGIVTNCYATGTVVASGEDANVGGLVGDNAGTISKSYMAGSVSSPGQDSLVGGLVGYNGSYTAGIISESFSSATVTIGLSATGVLGQRGGGLVGESADLGSRITDSFATGPVRGGSTKSYQGGLVGYIHDGTIVTRTYATGPVQGTAFAKGGLIGMCASGSDNTHVSQSYATGLVSAVGTHVGGLIGYVVGDCTASFSYWDTQTSGRATSAAGNARTTAQLQASRPIGFNGAYWGITPGVTYPYLKRAGLDFWSALATTVLNGKIFVFLPLSQLDTSQYAGNVTHQDKASLATTYTIIARAIGNTKNVAKLKDVKINTYFWNDATQVATWKGPVINHATLGPLTAIPAAQPIRESNVIGPLRSDKVVIIRGVYTKAGGGAAYHWMLATSFIVDGVGVVTSLVADDPWTGQQVRIDPTSKAVTAPANFPLANFKVNGFQVVTLVGGAAPLLAEIR